jgi:hypothetical protein
MIRSNRTPALSILLALIALMATPAMAQTEAGRLLFARGVVSIVGDQDSARGARTGDPVYEGERIVTGRSGVVQLRLNDGALVALRSSSDYHIQRQGFDPGANVYEQAGQLVTGWMRMVTGAIGARNPASVSQSTTVATIGIRGTVFQVIHIPEGGLPGYPDTAPGTYLMLEEGSVEITTEGGKRLLQPGDVIWVADTGSAPQLAPEKKSLFSSPIGGEARYVDLQDIGVNDFTNETLLDSLIIPRPFTNAAAVGFGVAFECCLYRFAGDNVESGFFEVSGSGSSRTMSAVEYYPFGDYTYLMSAFSGEKPVSSGYYRLTDGSEINWGVWGPDSFTVTWLDQEPPEEEGTGGYHWLYMTASNALTDPFSISSKFEGQATYNWVGGTNFMGDDGQMTGNRITGGQVQVNFSAGDMFFDLATNFSSNLTNSGCASVGCSILDFYSGNIYLNDGIGDYSGSLGGYFVGDGQGLISSIQLSGPGQESYYGTAAFAGSPTPVPDYPVAP